MKVARRCTRAAENHFPLLGTVDAMRPFSLLYELSCLFRQHGSNAGPYVFSSSACRLARLRVLLARWRALLLDFVPCLQEIRHVLGSAGGGGADGVPADDPVTSLDMCVASDCLLAGHGSGRILLWDYLR